MFLIMKHFLQDVPNRHLNSTCNSVNNNYYAYLIRKLALSDKIDVFMGSFKLRVELTKLINYLIYFFCGEIFSGMNEAKLIVCRLQYVWRHFDELSFSVIDYYVSGLHEKKRELYTSVLSFVYVFMVPGIFSTP